MNIKEIIEEAIELNKKSYSPYSKFQVSAILVTGEEKKYKGVNIENASYSMTMCAERVAMFSAIADGETEFFGMVIVGGKNGKITDFCYPCGACRQVMAEFCDPDKFMIILAKSPECYNVFTLRELLPQSFKLDTNKDDK